MILYLAGLKGVDPTLREAAAIDGANAVQTFFRVVFPAMRPINIVIVVITVIESLRAFDIVYVINRGTNGLELISALVDPEPGGRGAGDRRRLGAGGDAAGDLAGPDHLLPLPHVQEGRRGMSSNTLVTPRPHRRSDPAATRGRAKKRHYGTHLFLIVMAVIWLVPLLWTLFTALRPKADTDKYGYFSSAAPSTSTTSHAWTRAASQYFVNSVIITVPSVLLILLLASMMAFAVSRFSWRFNITLLIMFTAGNLLPPQVLAAPLFEMFKHFPLP